MQSDDFCASLDLRKPNNGAACQLWGFLLDLLASQRANPLTCVPDNRTDTLPKTRDVKGGFCFASAVGDNESRECTIGKQGGSRTHCLCVSR